MSEYHKDCARDPLEEKPKKEKPLPPIKKKPFCDCSDCECKDCPDILKMLAIRITDTTCTFGPHPPHQHSSYEPNYVPQRTSLLDVLKSERDCDCSTVTRAVRSHLHMNLGLSQHRKAINKGDQTKCTNPDCEDSDD